jgi:perosamine synthetase
MRGGRMKMKIPLFKTRITKEDIHAVNKVLMRGTFLACGPEIEEFEKKVAKFLKAKHVLSFNSGTSALVTLLQAFDLKGKEVIIPSFSFVATANAVVLAGAKPVFVDVEMDTFGLDYEAVKKKVTKRTGAVMIVHYGGCPARDSLLIKSLCKEKKILFLEDAAESFGSKICDEMVGNLGDGAIFSLCQNKVLSTCEGGLLVTNNEVVFERAKLLRNHGRPDDVLGDHFSKSKEADYLVAGNNFRLSTLQAVLGISQLRGFGENVVLRQAVAAYYREGLRGCPVCFQKIPNYFKSVYQMFTIVVEERDKLQKYLEDNDVMSKIYFDPIHKKGLYKGCGVEGLKNTEFLAERVLTIPLFPDMGVSELDYVISCIKRFYKC